MERKTITELVTERVVNKYVLSGKFGSGAACQTMTYPDGNFLIISTKVNTLSYTLVGGIIENVRNAIESEGVIIEICTLSCVSIGYGMTLSIKLSEKTEV